MYDRATTRGFSLTPLGAVSILRPLFVRGYRDFYVH
jgi:hypothetical protein